MYCTCTNVIPYISVTLIIVDMFLLEDSSPSHDEPFYSSEEEEEEEGNRNIQTCNMKIHFNVEFIVSLTVLQLTKSLPRNIFTT